MTTNVSELLTLCKAVLVPERTIGGRGRSFIVFVSTVWDTDFRIPVIGDTFLVRDEEYFRKFSYTVILKGVKESHVCQKLIILFSFHI